MEFSPRNKRNVSEAPSNKNGSLFANASILKLLDTLYL